MSHITLEMFCEKLDELICGYQELIAMFKEAARQGLFDNKYVIDAREDKSAMGYVVRFEDGTRGLYNGNQLKAVEEES